MRRAARRLYWGAGIILPIVLVACGVWWWRAGQVRAAVVAVLPAQPDLSGSSSELVERVTEAGRRARSLRKTIAGLAELARLYQANGFLSEARMCVTGLIALDPTNPLWPYLEAHARGGYGSLEEALPMLQRAIELSPDYLPARIRLGDTLVKLNRLPEAETAYQEVLARNPDEAYATVGLARCEMAAGRAESARRRLQDLVNRQPQFAPGWVLLISLDEQLGDTAAAAQHRSNAPDARPREMPDPWIDDLMNDCYDPYRLAVAASAADPANHQARARQLLERAASIAPRDDLPFRLLGNLLSDLGDLPGARRNLERATENNPKEPDNWSHLVRVLKMMGDMPAANRALDAGLARCPDAAVLHLENGRRLAAAGQLDAAAIAFERARRLRPEDSSAPMELAGLRFKQDRLEEGVSALREVVKIDPNHPVAVVLLARYAISNGDEALATEWIRRAKTQPLVPARDLQTVLQEYHAQFGGTPE